MKLRTRKRGLTKGKQIEMSWVPLQHMLNEYACIARRRKLRSCGTRLQLFVGEDTNCFGEDALSEAEASTDANRNETDSAEVELIASPLAVSVMQRKIYMMSWLSLMINVECQRGVSRWFDMVLALIVVPEKDLKESRNEEIDATNIGLASTDPENRKAGPLMSGSDSAKDEMYQESGCKIKEPLKEQALQLQDPVPAFDTCTATSTVR